ncbi:MAG: M1 family aminopeptidase [Bacteroidota bacterium]
MIVEFPKWSAALLLISNVCWSQASMSISPLPIDTPKTEPVKREIYRGSNERSSDLIHTKLEVSFDWNICRLNGKATLELKPYFYPTKMLYLNARGMEIKSLEVFDLAVAGSAKPLMGKKIMNAKYSYEHDSLKINLGKEFYSVSHYFVIIQYVAKPNELKNEGGSAAISDDKGLYFINPKGENPLKMPQIWTQGETQSNSVWFPTIDSPNEKMTQEIYMTVDDKYTTLSNGVLVSSTKLPGAKRVDYWKLDQAHAPYLTMMAVGEFKKVVDLPWKGKEISYYVEKEYEAHAKAIFGDTREMIDFFSNKLGVAYAWPKYAQIVARDYVSGAMENTSATLHGDFMVYQTTRETMDEKKGNDVIAHELFHQWFGDLVTCESWSNLSLNESFATYGEYLWEEYKNGRDAADYHSYQSRQGYINSKKEANLIRFNYHDKEDVFDGISYNKGGQILHMLRKAVGDAAFFASLKNYLETNKYKSAEVHHLRLAFEETTGKDLNWFFNQWYLEKGRPDIAVSSKYNASNKTVELTVEQKQDLKSTPLFLLPLDIDIYTDGKVERKHIVVDAQKNDFSFKTNGPPQLINFDAERQLLCDLSYTKTKEEYIFQYNHAPLFGDRWEALHRLESELANQMVFDLFVQAAKKDAYYIIRNYAITQLEKASDNFLPEVKKTLLEIYQTDLKTLTRAKALSGLNAKFEKDQDVQSLNEKALNELSFAIVGEALEAIAKTNTLVAMQKAKQLELEAGKDIIYPIANLYAANGSDGQMAFFHQSLNKLSGFEMLSFMMDYAKLAKRCVDVKPVLTFAGDIENIGKGASKYMKFAAQKVMKDLISFWEGKESTLRAKIEAEKKEGKSAGVLENDLQSIVKAKATFTSIGNALK